MSFKSGINLAILMTIIVIAFSGSASALCSAGIHTIKAYAEDLAGNVASTELRTFFIDMQPPTMNITSPANGTIINVNSFTLNYSYKDCSVWLSVNNQPINNAWTCWYTINGGPDVSTPCGMSDGQNDSNVTILNLSRSSITGLSEGWNTVILYGTDGAGNVGNYTINLELDSTAPNATLLNPLNNTYTSNKTQNYTVNLTDNLGIKNATLKIYNQTNSLVNSTTFTYVSDTVKAVAGVVVTLIDGAYHWFVSVFDWGGNSYTTQNNTITIDTTPPVGVLTSPVDKTHVAVPQNFTMTISDTYSLKNATLSIYNQANSLVSRTTASLSGNSSTVGIVVSLTDGVYNWSYSFYDNLSNGNSTANRTLVVDTANPDINWYYPAESSYLKLHNKTFKIIANVYDSFLDAVNLTVYNQTLQIYNNFTSGIIVTTQNINDTFQLSEGNNTIDICGRDSFSSSDPISTKAAFVKVSDTKTTFDTAISRDIELYDSASKPLDFKTYNLVTNETWIDNGKHWKTTWKLQDLPANSTFKIILSKDKGSMTLLTDRHATRVVDDSRKYYWSFDDLERAGFKVTYTQEKDTVIVTVLKGTYNPTLDKGASKYTLDPIVGGLNNWCENVTMLVDTINPSLTVVSPLNGSTLSFPGIINVTLNVTANDTNGISSYWYSLNNAANVSFNKFVGIYIQQPNGETQTHTLYVYVNDTTNNVNSSFITFIVAQTGEKGSGSISSSSRNGPKSNESGNETIPIVLPADNFCDTSTLSGITTCAKNFLEGLWPGMFKDTFFIFVLIVVVIVVVVNYGGSAIAKRRKKKKEEENKQKENLRKIPNEQKK